MAWPSLVTIVKTRILQNIKVTETTSFYQLRQNNDQCNIDIVHNDAANGSHASTIQKTVGQHLLSPVCQYV